MLCDNIKIWFNDYLDGDLDARKKTKVDAHLKQCVHCRNEFEKLKRADDCLRLEVKRMFKEIPVPGGLISRIEDKIKESGGVRQRLPFYRRISSRYAGIAAALIIFAVSYGAFSQYQHHITMSETLVPKVVEQANHPESNHPAQGFGPGEESDIVSFDQAQTNSRVDLDNDGKAGHEQSSVEIAFGGAPDPGRPAGSNTDVSNFTRQAETPARLTEAAEQKDIMQVRQDTFNDITSSESLQKLSARAKGQIDKDNETGVGAAGTSTPEQMDVNELNQGVIPLIPSYLPSGAVLTSFQNAEDIVYIEYAVGGSQLRIEERLMDQGDVFPDIIPGGKKVRINGKNGNLLESGQTDRFTLVFKQSNLLITLEGDLPVEEILRIAETLVKS